MKYECLKRPEMFVCNCQKIEREFILEAHYYLKKGPIMVLAGIVMMINTHFVQSL